MRKPATPEEARRLIAWAERRANEARGYVGAITVAELRARDWRRRASAAHGRDHWRNEEQRFNRMAAQWRRDLEAMMADERHAEPDERSPLPPQHR